MTLKFPLYVRPERRGREVRYSVRPLFLEGPHVAKGQFERSLGEVRRLIRSKFELRRADADFAREMRWYQFNPALVTETINVSLKSGRREFVGPITAIWFERSGTRWVTLPAFSSDLFLVEPVDTGRYPMAAEVERIAKQLLRERREEDDEDESSPDRWAAQPDEFITELRLTFPDPDLAWRRLEPGLDALLEELLGSSRTFAGAIELPKVARSLNDLWPDDLGRAVLSDDAVDQVRNALYSAEPQATVLVGPPGVGKTSLVHEAVSRFMASQKEPHDWTVPRVWHLDPNRIIAGMSVVGAWQRRFEAILAEVEVRLLKTTPKGRPDALYTNNLAAFLEVGRSSHNRLVLADVLKPRLAARAFPFVAECTPEEWRVVQERDRGFADHFRVLPVAEPEASRAIQIVLRERAEMERKVHCTFDNDALARIFDLHRAYPSAERMPGAIIGRMRVLASRHGGTAIGSELVEEAFSESIQVNRDFFREGAKLIEADLEKRIRAKLVGQDEAVHSLLDAIHLFKARMGPSDRPLVSLLFAGPTGVGKTEAAKVLAATLFTGDDALVRFDMNEYVDDGAVERLIGGAGGTEGRLTGRVRHRPYCVLLFDEIEKANPGVHDLLLQVLGEGRLTDSLGRTADFTNCLVILSSNLGATDAARQVGFSQDPQAEAETYRKAVSDFFRPEFVNRLDRVIPFRPLVLDEVRKIARLQVEGLLQREGLLRRATSLSIRATALDWLARRGFDPRMGGRALKRAIERDLTVVAAELLAGMPPGEPVLVEVFLAGDRLRPRITTLPCVPYKSMSDSLFSDMPDRWLREKLESALPVLGTLSKAAVGAGEETRARLSDLKARVRRLNLTLSAWADEEGDAVARPARGFTLRRQATEQYDDRGFNCRDMFAQLDIRDYLDRHLKAVHSPQAGAGEGNLVEPVAWAAHQARVLLKGKAALCALQVRSLVEGAGSEAVESLESDYIELIRSLDADPSNGRESELRHDYMNYLRPIENPPAPAIEISGELLEIRSPGAYELLRAEEGTHLFLVPHGGAVPVQVRVLPLSPDGTIAGLEQQERERHRRWLEDADAGLDAGPDPWAPGPIVRIYAVPGGGLGGSVTDLRTGDIVSWNEREKSLFAWLWNALEDPDKLVLRTD